MIRCMYCDRLGVKQIRHKQFFFCPACPERLWMKLPAAHPRWCPKIKEEKENEKS